MLAFSWIKWRKVEKKKQRKRKVPFFVGLTLSIWRRTFAFTVSLGLTVTTETPQEASATTTVLITLNLSLSYILRTVPKLIWQIFLCLLLYANFRLEVGIWIDIFLFSAWLWIQIILPSHWKGTFQETIFKNYHNQNGV